MRVFFYTAAIIGAMLGTSTHAINIEQSFYYDEDLYSQLDTCIDCPPGASVSLPGQAATGFQISAAPGADPALVNAIASKIQSSQA